MDKSILQIRHGLYKQVAVFFVLMQLANTSFSQTLKIPVLKGRDTVAFVNKPTLITCEDCYIIDTVEIFQKLFYCGVKTFQYAIQKDSLTKKYFSPVYNVHVEKNGKKEKLFFDNIENNTSLCFYIKEDKTKKAFIYRYVMIFGSQADIKSEANGTVSYPSSYICSKSMKEYLPAEGKIDAEYLSGKVSKDGKICFHCPVNYSVDECLQMKKKGIKMKWKN